MKKTDHLDLLAFMNGLVFFAPVSLLVRTMAGISLSQFFMLQAILSFAILIFEVPAGKLTDKIGYRNTIILSQLMLLAARLLLMIAFMQKSFILFAAEAVVEGLAYSLISGTQDAYIYTMYSGEAYVRKSARIGNCGTVGFIISTISYAAIYHVTGIEGLLVSTAASCLLGLLASFGIKKEASVSEKESPAEGPGNHSLKMLFSGRTVLFVILLSAISIAGILISFFYVDKLQACGIDEEWLTAIILGYSAIELLAEKILNHIERKSYRWMFAMFFAICGLGMIAFGFADTAAVVIALMLIIPLLLDIPSYILGAIQNEMIDSMGQEEKRAEFLSVFNMGVNVLEIVFLFASSAVAGAGAAMCFVLAGLLFIVLGVISTGALKDKKSLI